ncbi:MAG: Tim44/TimA family putative adaptor protein [Alphaproteobacteria bacterium]|nr:Tim44/TimA family putative adaptor protein [Alphaproteobacteria bacterium]
MGDFQFIDIVFFAMVALFLVLRLRSVLGKRTGSERRRPDPYSAPPAPSTASRAEPDNVIALPDRAGAEQAPGTAGSGIAQIRAADPRFNEQQFLAGARAAFEMIIGAFAAGDRSTLQPLLSDEVFDNFSREIDAREQAHEKLDNTIVRMRSSDVAEARMEGRDAVVTVKFVSEQINILRDEKGDMLPGQSTAPAEVIDLWTFRRNTRSSDPTWTLVATGTAH